MKKYYIAAALCLLALGACKKNAGDSTDPEETLEPAPVTLCSQQPLDVIQTKGMGILDGWKDDMQLYVYAIAREGENSASTSQARLDFNSILIPNWPVYERKADPVEGTDRYPILVYRDDTSDPKEPFYYDENRRYEFFGYFVDDACGEGTPQPQVVDNEKITLDVKIDGSQDLLLAMAHKGMDNETPGGESINANRMYSAYAARKGITPNLRFMHQLSRFNIYVSSGDNGNGQEDLARKLTISRFLVQSNDEGTLVIAHANHADFLDPEYDAETQGAYIPHLDITDKPLSGEGAQPFLYIRDDQQQPVGPEHKVRLIEEEADLTTAKKLGSVMVMPGKQKYALQLGLEQDGYNMGSGTAQETILTYNIDFSKLIPLEGAEPDTEAQPGHQYNVELVIYGLQEVMITVSMSNWEPSGSFHIDPDAESEELEPNA